MRTVTLRIGTYVKDIGLDVRVTSYTQKACFNALNQYQENGILEIHFLGEMSHLRTDVIARRSRVGCAEKGTRGQFHCHRWIKTTELTAKRRQ